MTTKRTPRKGNSRGPMAQSDAERKRKGTLQPSRALKGNSIETDLIEIGAAPEDFTPTQVEQWDIHAKILNKLKGVTEADIPLIRQFAILGARMVEANEYLNESSIFDTDSGPKKHPYVEVYNTTFDRYSSICHDFGMSPKGRQRIRPLTKEDEIKEKSEGILQKFISQKPKLNG
jgi:P27 family predicted phage terminase small subunit